MRRSRIQWMDARTVHKRTSLRKSFCSRPFRISAALVRGLIRSPRDEHITSVLWPTVPALSRCAWRRHTLGTARLLEMFPSSAQGDRRTVQHIDRKSIPSRARSVFRAPRDFQGISSGLHVHRAGDKPVHKDVHKRPLLESVAMALCIWGAIRGLLQQGGRPC